MNANERYNLLADAFARETGLWPPGRSRPAVMGPDPVDEAVTQDVWQRWTSTRRQDILSMPPVPAVEVDELRSVLQTIREAWPRVYRVLAPAAHFDGVPPCPALKWGECNCGAQARTIEASEAIGVIRRALAGGEGNP